MFILAGNCRTFLDCIYSICDNIIIKLFPEGYTIYIYLYLKLTDPGPKGQHDWNFLYHDIDYNALINKINELKERHYSFNIEYKILTTNEITDEELMSQVKNRNLYNGYYSEDNHLIRGLQCHYNFVQCGNYILEKEKSIQFQFDYIIYIRPDLFFTSNCNHIDTYSKNIVTLGGYPNSYNNDHIAIIPRNWLNAFFFDRNNLYKTNNDHYFDTPETVYWHTIHYELQVIGDYYIKRSIKL